MGNNVPMLRTVCLAFLLVIPSLWARESSPPDTAPQQKSAPAPGSDAGSAESTSGGAGSSAAFPLESFGKEVTPPHPIYSPDPAYPPDARDAQYSGMVLVGLIVDLDGSPKQFKVVKSLGMGLDEAALATVRTWRFQPAVKNGQPVAVRIFVEIDFKLYGVEPVVPLHSPREASDNPPQFPEADLKKYPLVFFVGHIKPVPMGHGYEIIAKASRNGAAGLDEQDSLDISCESKKKHCSMLWRGFYPARWIVENQQLEVLGQRGRKNDWEKAEYMVKPVANP